MQCPNQIPIHSIPLNSKIQGRGPAGVIYYSLVLITDHCIRVKLICAYTYMCNGIIPALAQRQRLFYKYLMSRRAELFLITYVFVVE